jgi:hypothetical protein
MSAAAARRTAHRLIDVLGGRADPTEVLAEEARVWVPHRGWSDGAGTADLLRALGGDLSGGELAVDAVVAADDLVVVEASVVRAADRPIHVTATVHLDDAARAVEIRVYLDPQRLGSI